MAVYRCTSDFPREEQYGLTQQLRRACVSIPTNIAEGCGRGSDPELVRFLWIAQGSAAEVEYQLLLCKDLAFIDQPTHASLESKTREVQRMLTSLTQKLSHAPNRHTTVTSQRSRLKTGY
jgi:four helix bundle protein